MGWTYSLKQLAKVIGAPTDNIEGTFSTVSTDTRTLSPGAVFFALKGERFDGKDFVPEAFAKGACAAVTTEAIPGKPCLVVSDPLLALQEFAAWHRKQHQLDLIAITGSCGKTTSKEMIAAVLESRYRTIKTKGNYNNEIGCPLSLLEIDRTCEKAVIEMGASKLGDIDRLCQITQPTESAVTMVTPAHLEGFGSIENIAKAKSEIVQALPHNGIFYVNMDNEWCVRMAEGFDGKKVRYGTVGDVVLESCEREESGEMRLNIRPIGQLRLPIPSKSHAWNVLLAVAVGLQHGVGTRHEVCETPRYFEEPLRKVLEQTLRFKIEKLGDIEIIDDSYNANPTSMAAALQSLAERRGNKKIAVLGDMLELGGQSEFYHREIGKLAGSYGISWVLAYGMFAPHVVETAKHHGVKHTEVVETHEAAAEMLTHIASPGDCILIKGSRGMKMEKVIDLLRDKMKKNTM